MRSRPMDIFSVITLLGGLAFFLYGMNVMSGGLEKMAKGKLEVWPRSKLWLGFNPWPRNFNMPWLQPKKKKFYLCLVRY